MTDTLVQESWPHPGWSKASSFLSPDQRFGFEQRHTRDGEGNCSFCTPKQVFPCQTMRSLNQFLSFEASGRDWDPTDPNIPVVKEKKKPSRRPRRSA